ncbi:MAG: hypothetical protein CL930_00405 [Deltaproteobacteria bacterium]|nr:hypothetical protein [Deltaproteobacteria bacterium]
MKCVETSVARAVLLLFCLGCGDVGLKNAELDTGPQSWQGNGDWRDDGSNLDADADTDADTDADADADADTDSDADADSDTDADTDSDTDVGGDVGGVIDLLYNVNACPECFDPSPEVLEVSLSARFHSPMTGSWLDWMPPLGSCMRDPVRTELAMTGIDLGSWMYLNVGSSTSISAGLEPATNTYKTSGIAGSSWINNTSYTMALPESGHEVMGALITPGGFDDIQPIGILNPVASAFGQVISAENARFTWAPYGTGDGIAISLTVYDGATSAYRGEVNCWAPDSGSFTIPPDLFYSPTPFSALDFLVIAIHRYRITLSESPVDGSLVQAVAKKGAMGTGKLGP